MVPHQAVLNDIVTLRNAIKDNLAIVNPTAFNRMQLDELKYVLACYEQEFEKLNKNIILTGREALVKDIEGRAMYERHEQFKPKNRGL
jgi:hypothetical protein